MQTIAQNNPFAGAIRTNLAGSRGALWTGRAISWLAAAFETKELIAGYVVLSAASLEDAGRWAMQYIYAVEADEVDLRELE